MSIHKDVVRTHCKGYNTCLKLQEELEMVTVFLIGPPSSLTAQLAALPNIQISFSLLRTLLPWPVSHLPDSFPPPHLDWGSSTHREGVPSKPPVLYKLKSHFSDCQFLFCNLGGHSDFIHLLSSGNIH